MRSYIISGALAFLLPSLLVFGSVAIAERVLYRFLGVGGAYALWAACYIALTSWRVSALIQRLPRMKTARLFAWAFVLYSMSWYAAYFMVGRRPGEWLAAFVSTFIFSFVLWTGIDRSTKLWRIFRWTLLGHLCGYFIGGEVYYFLRGAVGMILWGIFYGTFFGGGVGAALFELNKNSASPASEVLGDKKVVG